MLSLIFTLYIAIIYRSNSSRTNQSNSHCPANKKTSHADLTAHEIYYYFLLFLAISSSAVTVLSSIEGVLPPTNDLKKSSAPETTSRASSSAPATNSCAKFLSSTVISLPVLSIFTINFSDAYTTPLLLLFSNYSIHKINYPFEFVKFM